MNGKDRLTRLDRFGDAVSSIGDRLAGLVEGRLLGVRSEGLLRLCKVTMLAQVQNYSSQMRCNLLVERSFRGASDILKIVLFGFGLRN